jgi:hypothetical protein
MNSLFSSAEEGVSERGVEGSTPKAGKDLRKKRERRNVFGNCIHLYHCEEPVYIA